VETRRAYSGLRLGARRHVARSTSQRSAAHCAFSINSETLTRVGTARVRSRCDASIERAARPDASVCSRRASLRVRGRGRSSSRIDAEARLLTGVQVARPAALVAIAVAAVRSRPLAGWPANAGGRRQAAHEQEGTRPRRHAATFAGSTCTDNGVAVGGAPTHPERSALSRLRRLRPDRKTRRKREARCFLAGLRRVAAGGIEPPT
jgi:hypothetical protein